MMSGRRSRRAPAAAYLRRAVCLVFLFLLYATLGPALPALAQSPTATLGGRVTDEREDVIVNATVIVTNTETGLRRETTTDGKGFFSVALLPPGRYTAS